MRYTWEQYWDVLLFLNHEAEQEEKHRPAKPGTRRVNLNEVTR